MASGADVKGGVPGKGSDVGVNIPVFFSNIFLGDSLVLDLVLSDSFEVTDDNISSTEFCDELRPDTRVALLLVLSARDWSLEDWANAPGVISFGLIDGDNGSMPWLSDSSKSVLASVPVSMPLKSDNASLAVETETNCMTRILLTLYEWNNESIDDYQWMIK